MEQNTIKRMLEAINKHIAKWNLVWSKDNDLIIAKNQHNEETNMDAIVFFPLGKYECHNQIEHINIIEGTDSNLYFENPCCYVWQKLDKPEDIVNIVPLLGFHYGKKGLYIGIDEFGTISVKCKDEFNN